MTLRLRSGVSELADIMHASAERVGLRFVRPEVSRSAVPSKAPSPTTPPESRRRAEARRTARCTLAPRPALRFKARMTWSILARDVETGAIGAAVCTRFFAVGALCPRVEGGVGALCTQALVNPRYAHEGLARLRAGEAPDSAVAALIAADAGRATRQLHMMAWDGSSARHTGEGCVDWAGHLTDTDLSIAGNMLAGQAVIEASRDAFHAHAGQPLAERLLAALEAGEVAGGDKRGRQSAALMIASADPWPDLDIRADDHPDPLAELRRLYAVANDYFVNFRRFLPGRDHPGVFDRAVLAAAVAAAREDARR